MTAIIVRSGQEVKDVVRTPDKEAGGVENERRRSRNGEDVQRREREGDDANNGRTRSSYRNHAQEFSR